MRRYAIVVVFALLALGCELPDTASGGSSGSSSRQSDRSYPTTRGSSSGGVDSTFSPARGVVCDRSTQVCYQDSRASVSQTQTYFGDAAARSLQGTAKETRPQPKWIFKPDADTTCDMRTQVCYGEKGPNVTKTRQSFGDAAAVRLEQSLGGASSGTGTVTKKKHGIGCDQSVQICYDENGPNVKQTRKYFGDAAAEKLKKQLKR